MIRRGYGSYGYGAFSPTGYRATVGSGRGGSAWVGGVRDSEMSSGSMHMPMATYRPIMSPSPMPKLIRPGAVFGEAASAGWQAAKHVGKQAAMRGIQATPYGQVLTRGQQAASLAKIPQVHVVNQVAGSPAATPAATATTAGPGPQAAQQVQQQAQPQQPIVLPQRLEQFAASRTGRFLEGRVERAADRRFGRGVYSAATGRGT